jgi:hypothetical protein
MSLPESNEEFEDCDEGYDLDIEDGDYGFIFDEEGNLKSVFLPKNVPFQPPDAIARILELLEIYDIDDLAGDQPFH